MWNRRVDGVGRPEFDFAQVSSLLFAAHHLSLTAALPLAALGATWSYLYLASGNLLVPVAIHALWNARVFAGTVLGL